MKRIFVFALALLMTSMAGISMAQVPATGGTTVGKPGTRTPAVKHRMKRQKHRIKQGVKSGQLTKDETKELVQDRKALRDEIKDAKSDGVVTKDERKDIHKDMNAESKKIYDLKHNEAVQEKK
jgi:septal ring factor EnvC (AmiA/AmiB activator)